jgi:hypothetical protein
MKLRTDFVTNSSSAAFLVRNNTSKTKTMWDLLQEAAAGPWEYVDWPHYDPEGWSDDATKLQPPPRDPKLFQQFQEAVAKTETFPPNTDVEVMIAWGEGGPIFCPNGLRSGRTRSFTIKDLGMC